MSGSGAMEIMHATPLAADVDPVPNIEPTEGLHSYHVRDSPDSSDDSSSDGNVLRP